MTAGSAPHGTFLSVNGSPSQRSKTRSLAALAAKLGGGTVLDVSAIDAQALLGRGEHESLSSAIAAMGAASVLVLATPVYRATYSGLLKTLLDQLPPDFFQGKAVVLAATGGSSAHYLCLDTGMRSVVASLHGWAVPTAIYATPEDFDEKGEPKQTMADLLESALTEAAIVTGYKAR